ncbi:MAG: alpha/beta fold hydrolase, partial [Deltaproteobacteria bacterium]
MKLQTIITLSLILGMNLSSTSALGKKPKHRGELLNSNSQQTLLPPIGSATPSSPNAPVPKKTHPEMPKEPALEPTDIKNLLTQDSAASAKPCKTSHSIETWVQITNQHSPVGGKEGVFFISDFRDVPQVFYLPSPKSWPKQISFFEEGVSYYRLSPNGNRMILASQVGGDEQYDLYLRENDSIRPLIVDREKRIESVEWGPNSDWFLFTSNLRNKVDMDLYRWDINKNSPELLLALEGNHTVSDISLDGKWVLLNRFRSVTDSDVLLFNLETKKLTLVTEHSGQIASKGGVFTKDSKGFFYISDQETGISQVKFSKITNPTQAKLMTSGKNEVEEILLDFSKKRLVIIKNQEGYSTLEGIIIDDTGQRKNTFSLPKLDHSILRGASFSLIKNNPTFFFSQTSSLFPAQIFSWNQDTISQWTESSDSILKRECLRKEQWVYYPTSDGKQIPAFVYLPSSSSQPIPFIVYIHGGPESQFRPSFNKIFQYFLERGYGVFAPNVRGSTGYGRDYTLLDNYKLRMDSVRDAIEGAKWLVDSRLAHKNQLGVYGGSYGGFMVLSMIENAPELFTAASESVGISNFVTFLKNTRPYRRALREVEYGPLSDEEFLTSISPIHSIEKIKTPLLIFHGANDPRVPVTETEQIVSALKKRDIPVEAKIFTDEGHGNVKLKNILEQARWMVHFFEKHFNHSKKEGVSSTK